MVPGPTPTTHYQPDQQIFWWRWSCRGLSRCPCSPLWPLHHLCHPKNNIFMTQLQRNQYLLPKTNDKNQQPAQQQMRSSRLLPYLLTPANPGEGRRSRIRMPHVLWWVGGYPSGYTSSLPMVRKWGSNWVVHCWGYTKFLTLSLLNMEKEEHLQDHLDILASLKARRIGRREDIKWLDGLKHFGETRN